MLLYRLSILGIPLAFLGCTTTQQPTLVNQLQIKTAQLENRLNESEYKINDLSSSVRELEARVEQIDSMPLSEPLEKTESSTTTTTTSVKTSSSDIIRVAASAQDVQKALKAAGYYTGAVDGKIGAKTQEALMKFQKDHNLTPDGVVGKKTWTELNIYLE